MKTKTTLLLILFFCSTYLFAQRNKESSKKIMALKVSHLTETLNLTTEEAQKFWPIYNEHESISNKFIRNKFLEIKNEIKKAGDLDKLNEERAVILFERIQSLEKQKFEENQKYIANLKQILPIKKILKLKIAEREFGRKLMRKYRQKRKE
ncbi:sensor of ECF-type sigma factor [uncultured Polaribacter sp.]|uniref:sensor of ECF-type sigma factor n=1 Tax=uncultured Polaribacter sp. TaxID=174711 RepID=UPI00262CB0BE|nr:sensor of ECF-type sigma factor [uncultured Polaribacter sp.]